MNHEFGELVELDSLVAILQVHMLLFVLRCHRNGLLLDDSHTV